jgi:hypothetical protein
MAKKRSYLLGLSYRTAPLPLEQRLPFHNDFVFNPAGRICNITVLVRVDAFHGLSHGHGFTVRTGLQNLIVCVI